MKTFAFCFFLAFGYAWSLQAQSPRFFPFARMAAGKTCSAEGGEQFCSADCKSMVYCNGLTQELTNCQAATGKPYCQETGANSVICTTDASACSTDEEKCPIKDGEFPNVMDCKKFVSCVDGNPTDYECSPNFVYHGGEKMCMPSTKCYNYNSFNGLCQGKVNVRLAYVFNMKLFVFCTETGPKLRRCRGADDNNIGFDPVSSSCAFICPEKGKYPDPEDKAYYYECVPTGTNIYTATRRKCPEGTEFDTKISECRKASSGKSEK